MCKSTLLSPFPLFPFTLTFSHSQTSFELVLCFTPQIARHLLMFVIPSNLPSFILQRKAALVSPLSREGHDTHTTPARRQAGLGTSRRRFSIYDPGQLGRKHTRRESGMVSGPRPKPHSSHSSATQEVSSSLSKKELVGKFRHHEDTTTNYPYTRHLERQRANAYLSPHTHVPCLPPFVTAAKCQVPLVVEMALSCPGLAAPNSEPV